MIKQIYIVLGGEGKEKPRTKKLIHIIQNTPNLNWNETKIILSGLSGLNPNIEISEAKFMFKFLQENNIPKTSMILEENSMDTLGNMIFSYEICQKLILENQGNTVEPENFEPINISLITETFHLGRSKELFLRLFGTLKGINPKIKFEFINTKKTNLLFWRDRKKQEYLIETALLTDFYTFNLRLPEDFRNYLFSLPIYSNSYTGKKKYPEGLYFKAIQYHLKTK
jgi:hypothetical protein